MTSQGPAQTTVQASAGQRLFAQYAHAPNALGYCGPQGAAELLAVACGESGHVDIRPLATQFSGAWPYQQVLASLADVEDPLDERVVRGYWTGNELTEQVEETDFGAALLARIRPQAGAYWQHLGDELLVEAAPTHSFHVFGVYPWSRLLTTGLPEPLHVLDSCRISWAKVVSVQRTELVVVARHLTYDGSRLKLGAEVEERVDHRIDGESFLDAVAPGDQVAVHWGFACDVLTDDQAGALERWTVRQLEVMAPRLAATTAGGRPAAPPAAPAR